MNEAPEGKAGDSQKCKGKGGKENRISWQGKLYEAEKDIIMVCTSEEGEWKGFLKT